MCLGIPGKIVEIYHEHEVQMGKIDFGGVYQRACLEYVPEVQAGDYVLVHVGFALSRINEEEAKRTLELLEELKQLDEFQEPTP